MNTSPHRRLGALWRDFLTTDQANGTDNERLTGRGGYKRIVAFYRLAFQRTRKFGVAIRF